MDALEARIKLFMLGPENDWIDQGIFLITLEEDCLKFLDEEFQTVRYDIRFEILDEETFSYDENTQIKIKGQNRIFDHTEKNVLIRMK